jgi:hypothetical protein
MNHSKKLIVALTSGLTLSTAAFSTSVRFLADYNLLQGTKYKDTDIGGLSGAGFDSMTNQLLIISDDKGEHQSPRFYTYSVTLTSGSLDLKPLAATTILAANGKPFSPRTIDLEGLAIFDSQRIFASSEGFAGKSIPRVNPMIFELGRNGDFISSLPIPDKFLPNATGVQTKGIYDNGAFETLSLSPDKKFLFTATEHPLVQDDTPANFTKTAKSRILRYSLGNNQPVAGSEFVYQVESNFKPAGALPEGDFENGISDMLALSDHELIAIERGGAKIYGKFFAHIRLFQVTIEKATTDVAAFASLQNRVVLPVKKELILDLDTIIPQLNAHWQSLDNIEAITFGPTLKNGHRTLLLISDDNFNKEQRTQAIALEIVE